MELELKQSWKSGIQFKTKTKRGLLALFLTIQTQIHRESQMIFKILRQLVDKSAYKIYKRGNDAVPKQSEIYSLCSLYT